MMLTILDRYIIGKYFATIFTLILLFIPIGMITDISEKVDKFKEKAIPFSELSNYYFDFVGYFFCLLFPVFQLLAVIWFTARLANNSEIIAILSTGVSFNRFLRPYIIAASLAAILLFFFGMYIVPKASEGFNEFQYKYFNTSSNSRNLIKLYRQISPNEIIYVSSYDPLRKRAVNFAMEYFDKDELKIKIKANSIRWIEKDSIFRLISFQKRIFKDNGEIIERLPRKDTLFNFNIDDLAPLIYEAETLTLQELNKFIADEKQRGSPLIKNHLLVRHRRWSIPVSSFILTIIGVAVASFRRRGGMGFNLSFGIILGFTYFFFDKIFTIMVNKSAFSPFLAAWTPPFLFLVAAIVLLNYFKR